MIYITDRFTISKREFTSQGYLVVKDSRLARTGILNYRKAELPFIEGAPPNLKPDDVVRVFRGPDELFDEEALKSFEHQPITFKHPDQLVDSKNAKQVFVGFSKGDVSANGEYMEATLVVNDKETIERIVEDGIKELSLGYTADIVWQPGVDDKGNPYEARQRTIRGNHIAIVPRGRCGASCKISDEDKTNNEVNKMPVILLDGVEYECPAQTQQAFDKALQAKDSEISALKDAKDNLSKELEDEKESSKKEKDEMQAKLDQAEENKVKDSDIDAMVEERSKVIADAKSILEDKDFEYKGKSNDEVRTHVVKDACPELDVESKSQDYINARFDALLDGAGKAEPKKSAIVDALKDHADVKPNVLADSGLSLSEQKRLDRIKDNRSKRGA